MKKQYLEAGEFVSTHGINGELRVYPWSDTPDFLAGFSRIYLSPTGGKEIKLLHAKGHKNICIVKLDGVDTIELARPYIGKTVWVAREDIVLEEGRYLVQDILGLLVKDADTGEEYGKIVSVTHPGKHDVYEIENGEGKHFLFPAADVFMDKIDVEGGCVTVRPIEGMFAPENAMDEGAVRK